MRLRLLLATLSSLSLLACSTDDTTPATDGAPDATSMGGTTQTGAGGAHAASGSSGVSGSSGKSATGGGTQSAGGHGVGGGTNGAGGSTASTGGSNSVGGASGHPGAGGSAQTGGGSQAGGAGPTGGTGSSVGGQASGGQAGGNSTGGSDQGTAGQTSAGGSAATACSAPCPDGTVCADGQCQSTLSGDSMLDMTLLGAGPVFDMQVLLSQQPDMSWLPSAIYKWKDLLQALYVMHVHGVADMRFWLGDPTDTVEARYKYALVNIAAFLGQSMKETIQYDACDENNWDTTNGYAISNSCGQLGQNYESYDCDMACPKAPSMQVTAVTHAKWYGAPGPFFAAPNSALIAAGVSKDGTTGHWDYSSDCYPYPATEAGFMESADQAYLRPKCEVYAGQKAGGYVFDGSGTSVEGCVWWGRGVIQTTGRCNFGKMNHYLGKTHLGPSFPPPATVLYPDISFCDDPEVVCASKKYPELKWIAGLFYWMSSVQSYTKGTWSYLPQLKAFVDGGMTDGAFIDGVSGIVNRGCYDPPCGTGPVDGLADRKANFEKVLQAFGL